MIRNEYYEQKHSTDYDKLPTDAEVSLPVTKQQFEDLLKEVAGRERLCDVDDDMRQVLAGWVHHLPNTQARIKITDLGDVLHKSVANHLTWQIDQEIKAKRLEEAKREADKAKLEGNILSMPPRPTPGMDAKS